VFQQCLGPGAFGCGKFARSVETLARTMAAMDPAAIVEACPDAACLRAVGFPLSALSNAGFTSEELQAAGFSPAQVLQEVGEDRVRALDTLRILPLAVLALSGLKPELAPIPPVSLRLARVRESGCDAQAALAIGYSAAALRLAGFSARDLRRGGVSSLGLRRAGFEAADLRRARCSAREVRAAGFSFLGALAGGYPPEELRAAGYLGVPTSALPSGLLEVQEAALQGYGALAADPLLNPHAVDRPLYALPPLTYANGAASVTREQIWQEVTGNFVSDLNGPNGSAPPPSGAFSARELRRLDFTVREAFDTGFCSRRVLREAGYSADDVAALGFSLPPLRLHPMRALMEPLRFLLSADWTAESAMAAMQDPAQKLCIALVRGPAAIKGMSRQPRRPALATADTVSGRPAANGAPVTFPPHCSPAEGAEWLRKHHAGDAQTGSAQAESAPTEAVPAETTLVSVDVKPAPPKFPPPVARLHAVDRGHWLITETLVGLPEEHADDDVDAEPSDAAGAANAALDTKSTPSPPQAADSTASLRPLEVDSLVRNPEAAPADASALAPSTEGAEAGTAAVAAEPAEASASKRAMTPTGEAASEADPAVHRAAGCAAADWTRVQRCVADLHALKPRAARADVEGRRELVEALTAAWRSEELPTACAKDRPAQADDIGDDDGSDWETWNEDAPKPDPRAPQEWHRAARAEEAADTPSATAGLYDDDGEYDSETDFELLGSWSADEFRTISRAAEDAGTPGPSLRLGKKKKWRQYGPGHGVRSMLMSVMGGGGNSTPLSSVTDAVAVVWNCLFPSTPRTFPRGSPMVDIRKPMAMRDAGDRGLRVFLGSYVPPHREAVIASARGETTRTRAKSKQ
jgi:hypothetical protein